jgi:hypothetical protein
MDGGCSFGSVKENFVIKFDLCIFFMDTFDARTHMITIVSSF